MKSMTDETTNQAISQIFAFDDSPVRVVGTQQKPLFVAADICRALGLENVSQALLTVPEEEKGITLSDTLGGKQSVLTVTEPGLYRLIFKSEKPETERFRSWVFKEVLPSIRRTGHYNTGDWLRTAFAQAKTGRVQMALLEMMGVRPGPGQMPVGRSLNPVDGNLFWKTTAAGLD